MEDGAAVGQPHTFPLVHQLSFAPGGRHLALAHGKEVIIFDRKCVFCETIDNEELKILRCSPQQLELGKL